MYMLNWIWELFDEPAEAETRLLSQLLRQAPELPDWSAAVQPVLTRLLTHNRIERPMFSRVLTMPIFNALALPHQTIVLSESLVEFCRNERDQLAFVLAHEAAHIYLGHAKERSRAKALTNVLRINPLLGIGVRFLFDRAFSREQEFEADCTASRFCVRAGYAPQEAIAFLMRLEGFASSNEVMPQLLSTHPPIRERIVQLQASNA
jgi:Zn-dependent protease with chaperone function